MSSRKKYTIDELRIKVQESPSYYWMNKYKVAVESKKRQKAKKAEFEEYLSKEMKTYGHLE